MKSWKQALLIALIMLTILSLLLSACGPIDNSNGNSDRGKDRDKDTDNAKEDQSDKEEDLNADKITICHRTGSAKHPYVEISISNNAAENGHAKHEGDLIPAPAGGCPDTAATDVPAK